jgi:hypothetical protein
MVFQPTLEASIIEAGAGEGPVSPSTITLKFVAEPGRGREPDPEAPGEIREAAGPKVAARLARELCSKSRAVVVTFPSGDVRLYRAEWAGCAPGGYPYRVKCSGCGHYRLWPRGSDVCQVCVETDAKQRKTLRKRAAVGASNKERGVARSFGLE